MLKNTKVGMSLNFNVKVLYIETTPENDGDRRQYAQTSHTHKNNVIKITKSTTLNSKSTLTYFKVFCDGSTYLRIRFYIHLLADCCLCTACRMNIVL